MRARDFPYYPFVVGVFPILGTMAANLEYAPLAHMVRPVFAVLAFTGAVLAIACLMTRNVRIGAAVTSVLVLGLLGFEWIAVRHRLGFLPSPWAQWLAVVVPALLLSAWKPPKVHALNLIGACVLLVSMTNLGLVMWRDSKLQPKLARVPRNKQVRTTNRPDIFYIILDGHGRTDSIKRSIGFDDGAFIGGLRKRGFYVADRSRSNYCQTEISIASSLNMDTIPRLLPNVATTLQDRTPLSTLVNDSEVAFQLRQQGYEFVAVTSGFPPIRLEGADRVLGPRSGFNLVETMLLQKTPLATPGIIDSMFEQRRGYLRDAFKNLEEMSKPGDRPRFVFAHILAPHPPFVFGPHGEALPGSKRFAYSDGSDFMGMEPGAFEAYRTGYAGQVKYIDTLVLRMVDRLLEGKDAAHRPVIILQGDHGSKLHLDQYSLQKTDVTECFPILNAYLVPDAIQKKLQPDITPINSFRLLLNGLFAENLPLRENRSWYSEFGRPYDFTDVTERVEATHVASAK